MRKLTKNRRNKKEASKEQNTVTECIVYAGDERGNVSVWDLLPTLNSLMATYGSKSSGVGIVETVECGNERRHIIYDAGCGSGAEPEKADKGKSLSDYLGPGVVSSNTVCVMRSWKAHADIVTSLQIIEDPPAILTSSADRVAKVRAQEGVGRHHHHTYEYERKMNNTYGLVSLHRARAALAPRRLAHVRAQAGCSTLQPIVVLQLGQGKDEQKKTCPRRRNYGRGARNGRTRTRERGRK